MAKMTYAEAQSSRINELRRNLQRKAVPFHNVFGSPEGAEVLEIIKQEFDPDILCGIDEHETVVRAAQRDVVRYIEKMIKLREENYG